MRLGTAANEYIILAADYSSHTADVITMTDTELEICIALSEWNQTVELTGDFLWSHLRDMREECSTEFGLLSH